MRYKKSIIAVLFFFAPLFVIWRGCGVFYSSDKYVPLKYLRLEEAIFEASNISELRSVVIENREILYRYYNLDVGYDIDKFTEELFAFSQNRNARSLYKETKSVFPTIDRLIQGISRALSKLCDYTKCSPPILVTTISGFERQFYVDREYIIVSLDFFLGPESQFKPSNYSDSTKHLYIRESIVSQALILYISKILEDDESDTTLLADMLFFGRVLYVVKELLPEEDPNIIFSYGNKELFVLSDNEVFIWDFFRQNNLLFTKNRYSKERFIRLSDQKVDEIFSGCPSGVGMWLGYKIVESYASSNGVKDLSVFIKKMSAIDLLNRSNYKPYI